MFDVEKEKSEFNKTRGDSLAPSTQNLRNSAILYFDHFCQEYYQEDLNSIVSKLKKTPEAGYNLIKKYKVTEIARGISPSTIKLRVHFVRKHLARRGITLDDKEKIRDIFGKMPKYQREAVTHENIESLLLCCDYKLRGLILIQSSSGMRVSEMLGLKVGDVTKKERYQIKIRADNTKTKTERITFISKEATPYLEYYLKDKSPEEKIFSYSRTGMTSALQSALKKAGLEKRYDHTYHRTISTHSFRAFFITQMGEFEGFFGHALAGHDHYMAQYDRYTPEKLLEKYIEGENNLKIFDRISKKKVVELEKKIDLQEEIIQKLQKDNELTKEFFKRSIPVEK